MLEIDGKHLLYSLYLLKQPQNVCCIQLTMNNMHKPQDASVLVLKRTDVLTTKMYQLAAMVRSYHTAALRTIGISVVDIWAIHHPGGAFLLHMLFLSDIPKYAHGKSTSVADWSRRSSASCLSATPLFETAGQRASGNYCIYSYVMK